MYLAAALALGAPAPALATSSLTAQPSGGATTLGLDGEGTARMHIVKVAELSLSTDANAGLTVSVASGSLTKDGGTPVAFQVALVDRDAIPPSSSAFSAMSGALVTFAAGTVAKDLYIKYTPALLQDPGAYAASIDIHVADN